ncbi:DUF2206 domain-containing protein [Candidatus Bathyarchaeota archaeon]|nr:DUF2206 domain-containing protein [Candidatus Bathyarchaeota archaeon]
MASTVWGSKHLLVAVLELQFMFNIVAYMDIPIVRQVLGFLYLTFVPGFLIMRFLKLEKLNSTETTLFSMGLSIAFLMFMGLTINELLPIIGVSKPLFTEVLITILNIFVITSCLKQLFSIKERYTDRGHMRFSFLDLSIILALICPTILSVIGTILMNTQANNTVLLLMLVTVPTLALLTVLLHEKLSFNIFPITILSIYIAILLATWLTTSYIHGYDSHFEFYSFKLTEEAALWNPVKGFSEINKGDVMLSVTILPVIYSELLNLDATWIFKVVYPLLASFVPLGLYQFYTTQTRKELAFLGTFFFMSNAIEGLGSIKQWIAYIFYVLLFLIFFTNNISPSKRGILFIIFGAALVVSHYATSYIFLSLIVLIWGIFFLLKKTTRITLSLILIFSLLSFAWYMFTAQGAIFDIVTQTADHIYRNLTTEFFNPESRGATVLTGLGVLGPPTYIHLIGRMFFYMTVFLMVVGFVTLLVKQNEMKTNHQFLRVIASLNMAILLMTIIVPNLAITFGMKRFYVITLVIMAPFCIFGGEKILANLHKLRIPHPRKEYTALILLLTVLIPFFLFQTGFVYEVTKVESWVIPLSRFRMPQREVAERILYETEVFGAKWLSTYRDRNSPIYADYLSKSHVLTSYGLIYYYWMKDLSNATPIIESEAFVYLRRLNIVYGKWEGDYTNYYNTSDISYLLDMQNKIYSNGECDIYKGSNITKNAAQD